MRSRNFAAVIALVILSACSAAMRPQSGYDNKQPVTIENMTPNAATVFLLPEGGSAARLGEVPAYSTRQLGAPESSLRGRIAFRVKFLAGETITTGSEPVELPAAVMLKLSRTQSQVFVLK